MSNGNGAGGAQNQPGGGEEPVLLTEAQLNQVNEAINKAFGPRFKSFEEKQAKARQESDAKLTESILGALSTKLDEFKTTLPETPPAPKPDDKDLDNHPVVKGLKKQLEDREKRDRERDAADKAKDAKLKDQDLRTQLTGLLSAHGIEGKRALHAIGSLVDAQKLVSWNGDGDALVFKDTDGEVDVATGLKSWVESEDGKLFLPPSGASGSGERRGKVNGAGAGAGSGNGAGKPPSNQELGNALAGQLGITLTG